MRPPSIGALRQRIVLEQRTQTPDSTDGLQDSFTVVATVWAQMEATRPAIYLLGQQAGQRLTHRALIRGPLRLDFDHVRWRGRRLRVQECRVPDAKGAWVELLLEELAAPDATAQANTLTAAVPVLDQATAAVTP